MKSTGTEHNHGIVPPWHLMTPLLQDVSNMFPQTVITFPHFNTRKTTAKIRLDHVMCKLAKKTLQVLEIHLRCRHVKCPGMAGKLLEIYYISRSLTQDNKSPGFLMKQKIFFVWPQLIKDRQSLPLLTPTTTVGVISIKLCAG